MSFQYIEEVKTEVDNLPKLQEILANENVILDSKYLPVMEQAEHGDLLAIVEMAALFTEGTDNIKANYNLANRYARKALEIVKQNPKEPNAIIEVLANCAIVEGYLGDEEKAKELLKEAYNLVFDKLPLKETLGNLTHLLQFLADDDYEESEE